jgi:hypothetical protein
MSLPSCNRKECTPYSELLDVASHLGFLLLKLQVEASLVIAHPGLGLSVVCLE